MNFSKNLKKNVSVLKKMLSSDDITFIDVKVGNEDGAVVFVNDLTDKESLGKLVLQPLADLAENVSADSVESALLSPEKERIKTAEELAKNVAAGSAALVVNGLSEAFSLGFTKFEKRAIAEPPTSTVIKGPREGFVESMPVNVSLIRRKLKTPDLHIEQLKIGKYSVTPVSLVYVDGIADAELVRDIKQKLNGINIDAVLDSSYVAKFLGGHKTSVFKQVGNTEKPDILAARILEGRVAVLVDGSPIALTVPYLLIEDFQSPGDYYSSSYSATLARILRIFAVCISILLPAFFVAAELFHLQLIPLAFLLTIVNSIKGIPLSPSYEMFFTLLIFEILNEASVRMPKYVGMVVSIVGGLVLGETAVTAGIISAPALMIIALSGICLYTVPELEQSFSVIRLLFLVIGGSIGGYGLILLSATFIVYLTSFENFSTPLTAPFSPLVPNDLKDGIYKSFFAEQHLRPLSLKNSNKVRFKIKEKD